MGPMIALLLLQGLTADGVADEDADLPDILDSIAGDIERILTEH